MAGVKTFVNLSQAVLQITLFVRQGADPVNQDGTATFTLNPEESLLVQYGSDLNPFLNGFTLFAILNGDLYSKVQFVTVRDSEFDKLLNYHEFIFFSKIITDYVVSAANPPVQL
ncbi:hypothetical protein EHS13_23575 [Paenibacillus psychroresistens]|uniref:Uncharacterized protein n=1 Tax=Paenibacillus psychroresistens TaxID=1778678 RepID=A0A6B8RQ37_9BACL|nr:hypothetical protein [Paenibacillus psychroresistens]QGQ97655.1 hypothetical protein EHS13_23575 [Paenibacillus psychroresistens]